MILDAGIEVIDQLGQRSPCLCGISTIVLKVPQLSQ
jgi:hypothetical protein